MKIRNISKVVLTLSLLFTASNMNALSRKKSTVLISTVVGIGAVAYYQPEVLKSLGGTTLRWTGWLFDKAIIPSTYVIKKYPYVSATTAISVVVLSVLDCQRAREIKRIAKRNIERERLEVFEAGLETLSKLLDGIPE